MAIYTTPFSIPPSVTLSAVTGFTAFEAPSTTDFSILTTKSIVGSNFNLNIYLNNNTVIYKLKLEYMLMDSNSDIFKKITAGTHTSI
jgi:hypothetical protein